MRRLLTWYVRSARNARPFLSADPHEVADLPDPEPVQPAEFCSTEDARQWFTRERANLVALTRTAADHHHDEFVWRLAACLNVVNNYGDLHEMLEVHQLGRTAAAHAGQAAAEAGCLNNMGEIFSHLDDNLRAGQCFEQAHQAFQLADDPHGEAVSLHNIAVTHAKLGAPADALTWHRQALAAFTAANNEWAMANVHRWMGDSNRELRRYAEANSHYLHARFIADKIRDQRGQGTALNRLARLSLDTDRLHEAIAFGEDALDIHDRTGDRINAAEILCTLAAVRMRLGAPAQAITHLKEAVRVHEDMRNDGARAHTLALLGDAYAAGGEPDTARDTWITAADLLDTLNDPAAHKLRARHASGVVPVPRSRTPVTSAYTVRLGISDTADTATERGSGS